MEKKLRTIYLQEKVNDTDVVKLIKNHEELASVVGYERLEFTKRKGSEINTEIQIKGVVMVHFKRGFPDRIFWKEDSITFINYVGFIRLMTVFIEILRKTQINAFNKETEQSRKMLL